MGRITVFTQPNCKYCDKVMCVIRSIIQALADELSAVKPAYGIEIVTYDVSKDPARSAQCRKLTRAHTVPQVFFNSEHIGNHGSCTVFSRCGELRRRLLQLAAEPHQGLPAPEAALVKVDADVAFSSQPTTAQLSTLAAFGFNTVLCLTHSDELGALSAEGAVAASTGLTFTHLPPPHPAHVSTSHVEVDLIPHIKCATPEHGPCTASATACVAEQVIPPLPLQPSTRSTSSSSTVGPLLDFNRPPTRPARSGSTASDGAVSSPAVEAATASPDMQSMVSGLTGVSDLSARDVWTLDGADLAGREPGEVAWTPDWFATAVAALEAAAKPVLVHDTTGVAACAVALALAAQRLGAAFPQVLTWARTLGHELEEHADLATAVQAFLDPHSTAALEEDECPQSPCGSSEEAAGPGDTDAAALDSLSPIPAPSAAL
ncbi:unnamed protein product [Symbiodinium sp. KB8]|nr:unnamed protein product [Symbiodinium sp. KB8]